jgi:hypothetical protein
MWSYHSYAIFGSANMGQTMTKNVFVRSFLQTAVLVVEEFASLEMRSLSIRFYPVNVVAVRM